MRILQYLLFAAAIWYLYREIGPHLTWDSLRFSGEVGYGLLLVLLLPLNSFLEVLKWHLLSRDFSGRGLGAAWRGVLIGQFYGLFTPNRIGDGAGRLHYLPSGMRSRGVFAFANGSIAQSLVTLTAGAGALLFADLWLRDSDQFWHNYLAWLPWLLYPGVLLLLLLYLEPGWLQVFRDRLPKSGFIGTRIQTLQTYTRRQHSIVLFLSLLRYAVFAFQFYFSLQLYGYTGSPEEAFFRIAVIYLISTLLPTAALAELGVRESVAVLLLPAAGMSATSAFAATLLVFVVNIGIPAVAGGILFTRLKKLHQA